MLSVCPFLFLIFQIRCLAMPLSLRQTITSTLMQYRTKVGLTCMYESCYTCIPMHIYIIPVLRIYTHAHTHTHTHVHVHTHTHTCTHTCTHKHTHMHTHTCTHTHAHTHTHSHTHTRTGRTIHSAGCRQSTDNVHQTQRTQPATHGYATTLHLYKNVYAHACVLTRELWWIISACQWYQGNIQKMFF